MSNETTPTGLPNPNAQSENMGGPPPSQHEPSILLGQKQSPSKLRLDPFDTSHIGWSTASGQTGGRTDEPVDTSTSSKTSATTGVLSPEATDRVFPMKSFVSVGPTPSASTHSNEQTSSYFPTVNRRRPSVSNTPCTPQYNNEAKDEAARRSVQSRRSFSQCGSKASNRIRSPELQLGASGLGYQISSEVSSRSDKGFSEAAPSVRTQSPSGASVTSGRTGNKDLDDPGGLLTARFKHVVTEGGHAVITGRDGETLQRCEDEPIHIPGAVQSFGMLLALEEEVENKFVVRVVSENSKKLIGYTPRQLFTLESFTDILSEEQADNLLDHVDFVRDEETEVESHGPEVFVLTIRDTHRKARKLWCAMHISHAHPNLIICEFELEDDKENPLTPPSDNSPEPPEDTLASEPTEQELKESTDSASRPLRLLRSARKRKGEAAAMEVFNIMSQVQEQLSDAPNLDTFLKILVGVVKDLTGFHRVMIYQFDQQWNGKVVTELLDLRATRDLYKGLHFPASDIPKQARDMYRINKVRLLYDRDQETARLVCRTIEDLETPLDLTHSYLRAMSPIHIKYLANMSVRSSMSISINAFNELWGLISCHAYGGEGTRVSFPIRKMCRLVGDSASRNIERLSYASRLQARKLINTAPTSKNPSGYIIASSDDLLKLFDADFGVLSIHGETKILGKIEATQEALALVEYLRMRSFTSVVTTNDISEEFVDLRYPPGFKELAGILLVPLSAGGADFIVFFRKGQVKVVKWAGNPYEKYVKEGTEGYLEPRKSFKMWTETVVGKCRDWTEEEAETAAVLCLVYGKFIDVWRQKEIALENSQMTKLLLANSAHEVRTPLNAIINYLEIAMEGELDADTRENLTKSHSASKSLIYVINDLLDLTKTATDGETIQGVPFDLKATFKEVVDSFRGEATRKKLDFSVLEHPHLPERVSGDQRKIRQAISNVLANAVEATTEGSIKVEALVTENSPRRVGVDIIVEDTGAGMAPDKLDALFAQLEQVQAETSDILEESIAPDATTMIEDEDSPNKRALGLGLAVVARVVKNMNGQLRVKSEEGKGSRFLLQIPFEIPDGQGDSPSTPAEEQRPPALIHHSSSGGDSFQEQQEVTLVGASPARPAPFHRKADSSVMSPRLTRNNSMKSMESTKSNHSANSLTSQTSGKSEVDRLIEAIQEPHLLGSPKDERRSSSSSKKRRTTAGHVTFERDNTSFTSLSSSRTNQLSTPSKTQPYQRSAVSSAPGEAHIEGSSQPLKAIKIPDDGDESMASSTGVPSSPQSSVSEIEPSDTQKSAGPSKLNADKLSILVAEDDPINSKIVQKRMQKSGHGVHLTVNGEECASAYGDKPEQYDVVLMDMQMPIVDGLTSTKMIRSWEKAHPTRVQSRRAALHGRVPIMAVSATLNEQDRQLYTDAGFDAWILKPINFTRMNELLKAIVDKDARSEALYLPGHWEQGGWFAEAQPDTLEASTGPDGRKPFSENEDLYQARAQEQERRDVLMDESKKEAGAVG